MSALRYDPMLHDPLLHDPNWAVVGERHDRLRAAAAAHRLVARARPPRSRTAARTEPRPRGGAA
jgi:hypothetical protein